MSPHDTLRAERDELLKALKRMVEQFEPPVELSDWPDANDRAVLSIARQAIENAERGQA